MDCRIWGWNMQVYMMEEDYIIKDNRDLETNGEIYNLDGEY